MCSLIHWFWSRIECYPSRNNIRDHCEECSALSVQHRDQIRYCFVHIIGPTKKICKLTTPVDRSLLNLSLGLIKIEATVSTGLRATLTWN